MTTINKRPDLWVVTNPTDDSEICDVLHETTLDGLQNMLVGLSMVGGRPSDLGMTIYTSEAAAIDDAEWRIADRNEAAGR